MAGVTKTVPAKAATLMQRRFGARWSKRGALTFGYLILYSAAAVALLSFLVSVSPIMAISVGLLYLLGHALRAMRLAALSIDLLGTSGRTTAAMHFATAPIAMILPLKTGEFLRLYALSKMSGSVVYSIVVLLIDRMYDSLFLLPILVYLTLQGGAPPALAVLTLLAATIPLTVVFVGPKLLTEVQRYVVASQHNPVTLDTLRKIDAARKLVIRAARVSQRQAPQLCVISFLIWLCEILICVILVTAAADIVASSLELLGIRLVTFGTGSTFGPLVGEALAITLFAQFLPWPATVWFFFHRLKYETSKVPGLEHAKREEAS